MKQEGVIAANSRGMHRYGCWGPTEARFRAQRENKSHGSDQGTAEPGRKRVDLAIGES